MGKKKYYVVWEGVSAGIYESWTDCLLQTKGYKGAKYKSFSTREEAERAFSMPAHAFFNADKEQKASSKDYSQYAGEIEINSLAVDAACSGNPGKMEYRGVYVASNQELFKFGPIKGTNNIGEFLAIVHALAYMKANGLNLSIYSDSVNAMKWVREKKCKTKLEPKEDTAKVFELIARAEKWLKENTYTNKIMKWETKRWGEIPADFGRK